MKTAAPLFASLRVRCFARCVGTIVACGVLISAPIALAQEQVPESAPVVNTTRQTVEQIVPDTRTIGVRELASLNGEIPNVPLIKLDVTQAQFRAFPQAAERIDKWVRAGGILVMHGDVARSFGYLTVAARLPSAARAGQLFGRARNAQWFGQHPVLWNGLSRALEGKTFGGMGVRLVWTQMASGDCHVTAHRDGIALLRVADLSTPEPPNVGDLNTFESNFGDKDRAKIMAILPITRLRDPVTAPFGRDGEWPILQRLAMVMAPWGKGWTFVMPRAIETHRGDGRRLALNFANYVEQLNTEWVGLPLAPLQRAALRQRRNRRIDWARVREEIQIAMQSDSAQWGENEVREIYARDSDATLDAETVSRGFNPKHFPGETFRDTMHAIAQSVEARYRGRFLSLAQSKTKILVSAGQLQDLMDALDEAAKVQAKTNTREGFGPLSAEDEASAASEYARSLSPENSGDGAGAADAILNAPQVLADATEAPAETEIDTENAAIETVPAADGETMQLVAPPIALTPSLSSERRTPTYRNAAGWMQAMLLLSRAQSEQPPGERETWLRELRRTSLDDAQAWLRRALFSMGGADVRELSANGRGVLLNDALSCWQRSLRAHWQAHDLGEPDARTWQLLLGSVPQDRTPSKINAPLRSQEIPNTPLQNENDDEPNQSAPNDDSAWFADSDNRNPRANDDYTEEMPLEARVIALRRRWLGGDIGGVPCAQIAQWIRDGFVARQLIAREPLFIGFGGVLEPIRTTRMGGLNVSIYTHSLLGSPGDGTSLKRGFPMILNSGSRNHKWTFLTLSGGQLFYTKNPIRGTLESNGSAMDVLAHQLGRQPDIFGRYKTNDLDPLLDDFRAQFLTALVDYIGYHQATRHLGWGSDTLDVMTFSNPVLAQQFANAGSRLRRTLPSDGAFGRDGSARGVLGQVAGINPLVSPLGVSRTLMLQSATQGRVIGTRLLLSMPTPNRNSHQALLRRSVGLPAALARLQARALLNSITEGGSETPAWMSEGITNLCRLQMAELLSNPLHPVAMLIPKQKIVRREFTPDRVDEAANATTWGSYDNYWQSCVEILLLDKPSQAPSTRLMQALYKEIGNGGVTEILQRLGSGQDIESAFEEVTGRTQTQWLNSFTAKQR